MARLEIEIGGDASGLDGAVNKSLGILGKLQDAADKLNVQLFKAEDINSLMQVGERLTTVTGYLKTYTDLALKSNTAFQDQQASASLENLEGKLRAITGSAQLFGQTLQSQQAQVRAYETAINRLLTAGLEPTDARVVALKGHVDALTASINQTKQANLSQSFETKVFDSLGAKLSEITGSAQLFGQTLQSQQAQVKAYESAISKLLSGGLDPTDSRITSLKKNIDDLNASMGRSKQSDMYRQFQDTGRLIPDLENKIKRLRTALSTATDTRGIVQYNIRLKQAQDELKRLQSLGVATAASTNSIGSALRQSALDANVAARGYNGVALEFGRIIQDAPFAANNFGAIGNNITRLTELLPAYIAQNRAAIVAQGGAATSANVLRVSLAGLVTGFGGISLAISLAVSAYTFYQQHVQRTAREQKKLTDETVAYADTLDGLTRARLQGTQNAQEELTNLRLLYAAYQDATLPLERRRDAYAQLQEMFPDYFKNISFEETATNTTKEAYDRLTASILASSRARAAANIITKNSEKQLENERKMLDTNAKLQELAAKEAEEAARIRSASYVETAGGQLVNRADREIPLRLAELENRIQKERQAILQENNNLAQEYTKYGNENIRLQEEVNKLLAEGGTLADGKTPKGPKAAKIEKPLYESPTSVALAGLEGVELELEKVRQKYLKFYNDLSEAATKKGADLAKINRLMVQAEADERVEANAIILAEEQRIASEIERIRTDSGIKATENRRKEILTVLKWYDEEIRKARGNAEILAAIEEGKHARINAINEKYLQQRLDAHDKIRDKIQALEDRPFRLNENNSGAARRAIEEDLRKRLKLVQDYYDELRKLHAGNVWAQAALFAEQANTEEGLKGGAATAAAGDFYKELSRATARFGREFYQTLTSINQMADKTFESIFSKLVDGFNSAMEEIFLNQLQKKMSSAFDKASDELGEKLTGAIAAAGLAGGIISGVTNKTSGAGQGIGKGLQGAASGAMLGTAIMPGIGTAIGAAVGGIAGALSGIFSAKKARREEELQQQQLLEAQKQTKLLERQNALAYTSSIIGRMTTEGVVTGVEINEFGQLTTKISGQDLLVVLDRANSSRLRGT